MAAGAAAGMVAALLCLWLWFGLANRSRPATAAQLQAATAAEPTLEPAACWFPIPDGRAAQCGVLAVPAAATAGRDIEIRYVVIKPAGETLPDPIVFVNGGPGDPVGIDARGMDRWWKVAATAPWIAHRDLVLFDQRGVGVSTPALACGELAAAGGRVFLERLDVAATAAIWRAATESCRNRLTASGLHLDAFNTAASVDDLGALLDGLGYRSWNIYAVSYGTRLALDFLRHHSAETRSVILDSVYPPDVSAYVEAGANAEHAFEALAHRCAGLPDCNSANPDLMGALRRVLARAASQGFTVAVAAPDGTDRLAQVDEAKLVEILFDGFYRWGDIKRIPGVITALAAGDTGPLQPLAQAAYETAVSAESGYGPYLAVECHDEYPFNPPDAIRRAADMLQSFGGFMLTDLSVMACPSWQGGQAEAATRLPVSSAVPVLLLSGEVDPITPAAWAKRAAETLAQGATFVFPGVGHGVIAADACAERLAAKFLAAPSERPFDECLLGLS